MNIEARLRESLQEKGEGLNPPSELKMKVMSTISSRKEKLRKRMVTGILAALLLVPTGVFASQTFLADELYRSFENLKRHIASATMEGFLRLEAKLAQAKGELGAKEYDEFTTLAKKVSDAKLEYADQYGSINYDALPIEKEAELVKVYMEIQPYFDRLNGLDSSKGLLTSVEYKHYIDSLMTHEEILAKSGINPDHYVKLNEIPADLQAEFQEAREFMEYVNKLQTDYKE